MSTTNLDDDRSTTARADDTAGVARRPVPPRAGEVIKHYELIREVGVGGMGVVFLARDVRLGRLVAVKFLLAHAGASAPRFLEEARVTARCRHENIVVIYDVGEWDGYPYLVLEYIPGRTLREAMVDGVAPTAVAAIELMLPVARALACAHAMGIVHRDLKPENILLAESGRVLVVDFGIAAQVSPELAVTVPVDRPPSAEDEPAEREALRGTLPYMSPQQRMGEPVDVRSDIWAAGIILFELTVGRHPLAPLSWSELAGVPILGKPMPSAHDALAATRPLADLIDGCLKKRAEERIGSAEELVKALERLGAQNRIRASLAEDESPFAGLAAFQEADAGLFFGRDDEIAAVVGRLRQQQLVAVAGPSGAGKSSFVRAGVIPALKRSGRDLSSFVLRPGRRPLVSLAGVLAHFHEADEDGGAVDPLAVADTLLAQPGHLGARLRARCKRRGPDHRFLLFVDQLEELYTLSADPAEQAAFAACLEGVADDASSPLRVVVTIRADFLDRVAEDRGFLAALTRGLVFLPPMTPRGMCDALERPLAAARHAFEDEGLAGEMLAGVAGTKSPLPLLQFTAMLLWEARDRDRRLLTRDAYRAIGGVAGALSTHADAVLAAMPAAERRLARTIFLRLVTPARTRAIVHLDDMDDSTLSNGHPLAAGQVVQHLVEARLLAIEAATDGRGTTLELAHESLIDRWATLQQWLDEDEQDAQFLAELRSAAEQWEKNGKAQGFLWHDQAARRAGTWIEQRRVERGTEAKVGLGARERGYLEAVVRLAGRTRRRRTQLVTALVAALVLVSVAVSLLAGRARAQARRADQQAGRADEQARQAQVEARQARNATRMAAARERQADPTTALALLREIEPGPLPRGWAEFAFWAKGADVAEVVLVHDDGVWAAAWSPDGRHIVSGSEDTMVRVWDAGGKGRPLVLQGHHGRVRAVAWSPDGKRIASASDDRTVRVWSADGTGQPLVLQGHGDRVRGLGWSPDGQRLVSASEDRTLRVWSADGREPPLVLRGHDGIVFAASWSPDGQRIASASADRTVRVWSADGKGPPLVLQGHEDRVHAASWSPDGQHIVSGSRDKTVRVWSADGKGQPLVLQGHDGLVYAAAWSPDGQHLLSASEDETVRVWSADGKGRPLVLQGHDGIVYAAAWSPDGQRLLSASYDKTVRVWNVGGKGRPLVLQGHDAPVQSVGWSPDGRRLVSTSEDRTVRVWSADGKGRPVVLRGHEDRVGAAAWSPDGKRIASASDDRTVRVWNADGTGRPLVLQGHDAPVGAVAWSPDGRRLVSGSDDKTMRVWSADGTGQPLVLQGHGAAVYAAEWSPDGQRLASASSDKTVRVWDVATWRSLVVQAHDASVASLAWSPDGRRLVSTSWDKTVRVWNADGTGPTTVLRGHEALPVVRGDGAWSADGKRVLSSSYDGTIRIWNADGSGAPMVIRAPNQPVRSASWSPDGKRLVAALKDRTIVVWSDLDPVPDAEDPRLWTATNYCMPLDVRLRLLGFTEEQSRADLDRCQRRVAEPPAPAR